MTARIHEISHGAMDITAMGAIHGERVSITGLQVKAAVVGVPVSELTPGGLLVKTTLEKWDGDMQVGSAQ